VKVVTVDGVERVTSSWGEFWEVAKREHSNKRVILEEKINEISAYIDVYSNTVQARINTNWFKFHIIYNGVQPLNDVVKELAKSASEWGVVYSVKYKAEYKVYEREIYYVAVEFNKGALKRLEIEFLTFEWPDREKLISLIGRILATIEAYLNIW